MQDATEKEATTMHGAFCSYAQTLHRYTPQCPVRARLPGFERLLRGHDREQGSVISEDDCTDDHNT